MGFGFSVGRLGLILALGRSRMRWCQHCVNVANDRLQRPVDVGSAVPESLEAVEFVGITGGVLGDPAERLADQADDAAARA